MSRIVGKPKYNSAFFKDKHPDLYIGDEAQEMRGLLKLRHPMGYGDMINWEDIERVWDYVYEKMLRVAPDEFPVLITERSLGSTINRSKIAEIMFEKFGVPSMYIAAQPALSLFAHGRLTGTVLDIGDSATQVVPLSDGYIISNMIQREDYGGRTITEYLKFLLRMAGLRFYSSAEFEVVREIKENCCFLRTTAVEKKGEEKNGSDFMIYKLPDGREITVGEERSTAPELLFSPELMGIESQGIHHLLKTAVETTSSDLHQKLYENIVLSGGSTLFDGFPQRFVNELESILMKGVKFSAVVGRPELRINSVWIGGAILASLGCR